jgi:hypothetical protein
MQALDVVSTTRAVSQGSTEANPVLGPFVGNTAVHRGEGGQHGRDHRVGPPPLEEEAPSVKPKLLYAYAERKLLVGFR